MSFRNAALVAATLVASPIAMLSAQQATDAILAPAPVAAAQATTPAPEPRNSVLYQRTESAVTPSTASDRAEMTAAADGSHTIVVSTLVLVLAVVILVLLIS